MHKLFLPRLGQTMSEALFVGWLVGQGAEFDTGTPLYEVETEKVATGVEATIPGRLVRVLAAADEQLAVGALLGVIASPGENPSESEVDAFLAGDAAAPPTAPEPEAEPASTGATERPDPALIKPATDPVRAMPRTRALARDQGIDIARVRGTGADGLVTEEDVAAFAAASVVPEPTVVASAPPSVSVPVAAPPAPAPVPAAASAAVAAPLVAGDVAVRARRRLNPVARRMAEVVARSWSQVPQFSQSVTVDATTWRARRDRLRTESGDAIGYTDMVLAAVVRAAQEVPEVNASFAGDELVIYRDVNVSVAVDTPSGLQVPVLHHLQDFTVGGISRLLRDVTARAREDRLTRDDVRGGTITVSNLGGFGIEGGFPMVTAPQTCIVFVGAVTDRVVAVEGGIGVRPTLTVVNAFDHRAVDGATAARFTNTLRRYLEEA